MADSQQRVPHGLPARRYIADDAIHLALCERGASPRAGLTIPFHLRYNAGQFDQIYDDASLYLRKSANRDALIGAMRKAKNDYGAFERVELQELAWSEGRRLRSVPYTLQVLRKAMLQNGSSSWSRVAISGFGPIMSRA